VTGIRGPGWAKSRSGPSALDGRRGKINEKKIKGRTGLPSLEGRNDTGLRRDKKKVFTISLILANLNKNSKFKFKSNKFLNSDKIFYKNRSLRLLNLK
jgi:hypothetical protein